MKQDGSALTRLDAAMLGLYLLGMRWIATDKRPIDVWAYSKKPAYSTVFGGCWEWDNDAEICPMQMPDGVAYEYLESAGENELTEILPWLESHGITPPEVVG